MVYGVPGLIAYSNRFIEIVDNIAVIEECTAFPSRPVNPLVPSSWPFPELWPSPFYVGILGEHDDFHSIKWHKQSFCLSPRALSEPFISHDATKVSSTSVNRILPYLCFHCRFPSLSS